MAYPHKWSPISYKSSAGQRKDTGQRPMLYRWTTQHNHSWVVRKHASQNSRWRPSAILDLLCECLDDPRRAFGGLYRCAKFGWKRCSSFDNMHVFRFQQFGWVTPIHAPKLGFFGGGFDPLNGEAYLRNPKKAHPWVERRHMTNRSSKSVHRCDL